MARPTTPMRGRSVRLTAAGLRACPSYEKIPGRICGEGRDGDSWLIQFEGFKLPKGLHKSFVEIMMSAEELREEEERGHA